MTAWEGLNRRKFPRVNFPCMVTLAYNQDSKEVILAHTDNIGIGGVCVVLKKSLKMFIPVDLEIDLIDGDDHIKCKGKVVWSIRRKGDDQEKPFFYDVGIEFVGMDKQDSKRIDNTIQKLVNKGHKSSIS